MVLTMQLFWIVYPSIIAAAHWGLILHILHMLHEYWCRNCCSTMKLNCTSTMRLKEHTYFWLSWFWVRFSIVHSRTFCTSWYLFMHSHIVVAEKFTLFLLLCFLFWFARNSISGGFMLNRIYLGRRASYKICLLTYVMLEDLSYSVSLLLSNAWSTSQLRNFQ